MAKVCPWGGEDELYSGYTHGEWTAIHVSAFVAIALSLGGSLYIIVEFLIGYKNENKTIGSNSLKFFPLFISICDVGMAFCHVIDYVDSAINEKVASGEKCLILGALFAYFINAMAMWVGAASFYIWDVVVSGKKLSVGPYFWRLQILCWGVPLVSVLPPAIGNSIGNTGVYCALAVNGLGALGPMGVVGFFEFTFIAGACVVSAICYGKSILVIRESTKFLDSQVGRINPAGQQRNVSLKLLAAHLSWFLLVYIIIWAPFVIFTMITVGHCYSNASIMVWMVFQYNAGGFFNLFAYGYLLGKFSLITIAGSVERTLKRNITKMIGKKQQDPKEEVVVDAEGAESDPEHTLSAGSA